LPFENRGKSPSLQPGEFPSPGFFMVAYTFAVLESTVPAKTEKVRFKAKTNEDAYKWVIENILHDEGNKPLQHGMLYRIVGKKTVPMMGWKRGLEFF